MANPTSPAPLSPGATSSAQTAASNSTKGPASAPTAATKAPASAPTAARKGQASYAPTASRKGSASSTPPAGSSSTAQPDASRSHPNSKKSYHCFGSTDDGSIEDPASPETIVSDFGESKMKFGQSQKLNPNPPLEHEVEDLAERRYATKAWKTKGGNKSRMKEVNRDKALYCFKYPENEDGFGVDE